MNTTTLLFTSEHDGTKIPSEYTSIFAPHTSVLKTHRGSDLGASGMATRFAEHFDAKLFKTIYTRLLVDVNRSLWRRTLFSEITKPLPANEKQRILEKYYYPHREAVTTFIEDQVRAGQKILHIALHSFTPALNGTTRNADIGFLYNPERKNEKRISAEWKKEVQKNAADLRVRFNYPYRGKPDGLTAHFRKKYADNTYIGIELEVNQKHVVQNGSFADTFSLAVLNSFQHTLNNFSWV